MPGLHALLESEAARVPDHPAYVHELPAGPLTVTWAETLDRVAALAGVLAARGVAPGDRVALLVPDGPVLVEATYALARLGAVRIGLNWRLGDAEIAGICRQCTPVLALVTADRAGVPAAAGTPVLGCGDGLGDPGELGALLAAAVPDPAGWPAPHPVDDGDVAAICYTTGSTGAPKGAEWTHGNVTSAICRTAGETGMRADDVYLHCLPGAGVPYLLAVWNATRGFTTVVQPRFAPDGVIDAVDRHGVTAVTLVPTMLAQVAEELARAGRHLPTLRKVVFGAAPSTPALVRRAREVLGPGVLEQWYGSTEGAGGWYTRLTPDDVEAGVADDPALLASCGRAMGHVRIEVVDDAGRPLPAGEVGEVAVTSPTVMRGYFGRPELSARVLGGSTVRTGDLGRLDDRGYLTLVDRKDFLVITGGYNVYPVEVEAVLAEHPAVADCCVFGAPDATWGERLVALVVPRPGTEPGADLPGRLREHCRGRLAGFKVPKEVLLVPELYRNATGKTQKLRHRDEYVAAAGDAGTRP